MSIAKSKDIVDSKDQYSTIEIKHSRYNTRQDTFLVSRYTYTPLGTEISCVAFNIEYLQDLIDKLIEYKLLREGMKNG